MLNRPAPTVNTTANAISTVVIRLSRPLREAAGRMPPTAMRKHSNAGATPISKPHANEISNVMAKTRESTLKTQSIAIVTGTNARSPAISQPPSATPATPATSASTQLSAITRR